MTSPSHTTAHGSIDNGSSDRYSSLMKRFLIVGSLFIVAGYLYDSARQTKAMKQDLRELREKVQHLDNSTATNEVQLLELE